jgi:DNA invertase Pin-like site-specific DNA recombinase
VSAVSTRAAIYVRVSTNDQDTGLQETELREYVESRGWSCTVYRDQGKVVRKMNGRTHRIDE